MMTPKERFDQALKASIRDPYGDLLSFSIDPDGVTQLQLHAELLRDETMFENLLNTLRADLPTHSLHVSLQINNDYNVDERFARLQGSLQDIEGMQIARVPYQENDQEKDQENESFWGSYLLKAGLGVGGAIAAPVLVTAGITALGFTAAGITAGSAAANLMSSYGGAVPAGSLCSVLQSATAGGLRTASTTIASTVGAVLGVIGARMFSS